MRKGAVTQSSPLPGNLTLTSMILQSIVKSDMKNRSEYWCLKVTEL